MAPPGQDLFAANRTRISLLGYTVMQFCCNGVPYSVRLAVTDAMQEMILGSDFLVRNLAKWDFSTGKLQLNGRWISLGRRRVAGRVRRICVAPEHEEDAVLQRQVRRKDSCSDRWNASRCLDDREGLALTRHHESPPRSSTSVSYTHLTLPTILRV